MVHALHRCADDDLLRVVAALRKQRPDIVIHVRADAGFGLPRMYEVCEQNHTTPTPSDSPPTPGSRHSTEELMKQAVDGYQQTKEKQRLFDCFDYQCDSWDPHTQGKDRQGRMPRPGNQPPRLHGHQPPGRFIRRRRPSASMTTTPCAARVSSGWMNLKNGLSMDRSELSPLHGQLLPAAVAHGRHEPFERPCRDDQELPEILASAAASPAPGRTLVIKVAAVIVQVEHSSRTGQTRRTLALVANLSLRGPTIPSTSSRPPDTFTMRIGHGGKGALRADHAKSLGFTHASHRRTQFTRRRE